MLYLFGILMTKEKQWDTLQLLLTPSPWSGGQRRSKTDHFSGIYHDGRVLMDFYVHKYGMLYLFGILMTKEKQWDTLQLLLTPSPWSGGQRRSKTGHFQESIMIIESWWTFRYINMACYTFLESLWPKKNNDILYSYFGPHLHDQEVKEDPKWAIFRNLS